MDRYFYAIELDTDGNKILHLSGNIYYNDADDTETNYRHAEWVYFYIPINEVAKLISNDTFYDYINERVHYLSDCNEEEALEICELYWDGNPGINLHIKNVNFKTECGEYWFDADM